MESSLPDEMRSMIFGYLTHTEKLYGRTISKDWNRLISWIMVKDSYFTLGTNECEKILLESELDWKNVKITDIFLPELNPESRNLITTFQTSVLGLIQLGEFMKLAASVPNLTNLDLKIGGCFKKVAVSPEFDNEYQDSTNNFVHCVPRLKKLSARFGFNMYTNFSLFLDIFDSSDTMCLEELIIREEPASGINDWNESEHQTPEHIASSELPLRNIYRLVTKSARSLRSLDLEFYSEAIQSKLFSELVSNLCTLGLELQTVLIRPNSFDDNEESDFLSHRQFLNTQMSTLRNLVLPSCSNDTLCEEFMRSLPRNLKFIGFVWKTISSELFRDFTELKVISIDSIRPDQILERHDECPTVRKCHLYFRESYDRTDEEPDFDPFYDLSCILIHLTELHIVVTRHSEFNDADFQSLIRNFPELRILEMSSSERITDTGVTSLHESYCRDLLVTKRVYRCLEETDFMNGHPLSSLRKLEKLILRGTSITDVGIYHGLRFGSTLKELTFSTFDQLDVSEWGINWLAAGNPALEVFDVRVNPSVRISTNGRKDVRKHLGMVEHTQKYKLVGGMKYAY